MVSGEWWMVESPGANFKEQSSNVGIAAGDGIVVRPPASFTNY